MTVDWCVLLAPLIRLPIVLLAVFIGRVAGESCWTSDSRGRRLA